MNKDNLIIFAVAALAVFGVYKMTRTTTPATTSGAINNRPTAATPGYSGGLGLFDPVLPWDLWGQGYNLDPTISKQMLDWMGDGPFKLSLTNPF